MTRIPKATLLLLGLSMTMASRTTTADIIYREIFPNHTQVLQALGSPAADTGWRVHVNSTGILLEPTSPTHGVGLGFRPGAPGNLPAVNSNPASSETNIGFPYTYTTAGYAPMLLATAVDDEAIQRANPPTPRSI